MLIPIIKESEKRLKKKFNSHGTGIIEAGEKELLSESNSSQLALLEGQVKMYEGMKENIIPTEGSDDVFNKIMGWNDALSKVIQSLEESITYLKSKI